MAPRGRSVRIKIQVDLAPLERMRKDGPAVLRELDSAVKASAARVIDISKFLVPRGGAPNDPLNLADTDFVEGPIYNLERLSTTWLAGYSHPAAIPIHAGWHWGEKTKPPPEWMRVTLGVGAVRREARSRVKKALKRLLAKYSKE